MQQYGGRRICQAAYISSPIITVFALELESQAPRVGRRLLGIARSAVGRALQKPLPNEKLRIVATGEKSDKLADHG